MASTTHLGLSGSLPSPSLPLRPRRRRLGLTKTQQEANPEPSWRTVAPILLFLLGLALMRLGAAEIGAEGRSTTAPAINEMVGD